MVVVVIPSALLMAFRTTPWSHQSPAWADPWTWLALVLGGGGAALGVWTAGLFARHGAGTAAPWDPPRRFVVRGPYRQVRNPMIIGVFAVLLGESMLLQSWSILGWMVLFAAVNLFYIPLVEEQGLIRRFGEDYLEYRRNVPRWLPRIRPWLPPGGAAS
jgi:protein-S-isoprenylcysteine O-methyltransferase Ste14